jgi:hypothetical protein
MNKDFQNTYPNREQMCLQWKELASEIFNVKSKSVNYPALPTSIKEGTLIIIGSGIQSLGFSMNDIKVIEDADVVFYCVADPATIVWLKKKRPDAYDLYTLYDDNKIRYYTYMQMTESMLYCLRQGKKVVAIFYGHPGIFVLSTHRAIAIAKKEGLTAEMRAGVSALDCLCADIGVDPSHPGMVTYEATDMLIRLRKPDTSLHVILWQVGLIAEMGYRRSGFINQNFITLVEYLQQFYGKDYEVVHYIASRYPTIASKIERYTLEQLKDPRIRVKISGLSTFYIAPKDARQTDIDMCIKLGLAKPGQTIKPTGALREIDKYDHRELKAIDLFENFIVPEEYQYQTNTPVADFLINLSSDVQLQKLYTNDPETLLTNESFSYLPKKDKEALISRDEGRIQIAAKGIRVRTSEQERFVTKVFSNQKLAKQILLVFREFKKQSQLDKKLEALALQAGFNLRWKNIASAIANIYASSLLPWTSVYADVSGNHSLIVSCNSSLNSKALIFIDTTPLRKFSFNNYTLVWRKEDGNSTNGCLQFSLPEQNKAEYKRIVTGKIWISEEPSTSNFEAVELLIEKGFMPPAPNFKGEYSFQFFDGDWKKGVLDFNEETIVVLDSTCTFIENGNNQVQFQSSNELLFKGDLTFMADPFTGLPTFFGTIQFAPQPQNPVVIYGVKKSIAGAENNVSVPGFPQWVLKNIYVINQQYKIAGGLLIYNQYLKLRSTGKTITQINNRKLFLNN